MVDVHTFEPAVVQILASAEAVASAVRAVPASAVATVAPGEALVIGDADEARIAEVVAELDGNGLVLDVSDGWVAWTLAGPDAREAFDRLSELELPDAGFVQGEVVRLPVKVLVEPDRITMLIPAMWGDFLGERIRTDCAAVGVREVAS